MAGQEHAAQARSNGADEIQPPRKSCCQSCLSRLRCAGFASGCMASMRKTMTSFLVKAGVLVGPWPSVPSDAPHADPFEAYMHACMSAPFFCYIPPAIYEPTDLGDEPDVTEDDARPGDDA